MSNAGKKSIFKIRNATSADLPALAILHVETFNETHSISPNGPTYEVRLMQWQQAFQDTDATWFCFVIENGGDSLIGLQRDNATIILTIQNFQVSLIKYIFFVNITN
jgi:hypothetical protein